MSIRRQARKPGAAEDTSWPVFRWARLASPETVATARAFLSAVAARPSSRRSQEGALMNQSQRPSATRRTNSPEPGEATPSTIPDGPLPARSIDRADSVFRPFSLSRFPKGTKSDSYVNPAEGATAQSVQREVIGRQLQRLSATDAANVGMTLALPRSTVGELLPSLNEKASTIELSEVLKIVTQHMRGTEFYANGNPALNRLALQARAREIVADIAQQGSRQPHEDKSARALLRRWRPHPHKADANRQERG
jgi:hypothetical protein